MILSKRDRTALVLIIAALGGYLLWNFAVQPLIALSRDTGAEILKKQVEVRKLDQVLEGTAETEKKLREMLKKVKTGVPRTELVPAMLSEIEKKAMSAGITITNKRPLPVNERAFYIEITADLELECTMATLAKFLYEIRQTGRIIAVDRLQLSQKGKDNTVSGRMLVSAIAVEEGGS